MTWGRYPNPRALLPVLILIQGSVGFDITKKIEPKSVVEGGSVIFHCTFSETPHYLFWNYQSASSRGDGVLRIATCPGGKECALTDKFAKYSELLPAKNGSLVINGAKRRNDGIYSCDGLRGTVSKVAKARVTVLVPPGSPQLASNNSSPQDGQAITLSCSSEGGNPVPSLKWRWLRADGTNRPDVAPMIFHPDRVFGTVSSKVVTTMSVLDHQSTVQCDALNAAENVTSSVLKLEVFKLPGRAEIEIMTVQPREGDKVELRCSSEGGNPKPAVTWTWIRENGETRDLPSPTVTGPDRPFGRTVSALRVGVDYKDNRASIRCSAENRVGTSGVASKPLQVIYKPRIEPFPHSPLYIKESQRLDVNCRAIGNPTPRIVWTKNGIEVTEVSGSSLRFSRLVPSNSGLYTCTASNAVDFAQVDLELRVIFPPSIINMPSMVYRSEGLKLHIKCIVNAYPDAKVHWIGPDNQKVGMDGVDLQINSISRKQAGRYTCLAENKLTPTGGKTTTHIARNSTDVIVKYLPSAPSIVITPFPSVLVNTDIWLQCIANSEDPGYPLPHLEWRRLEDNKILSRNGSHRIIKSQLADSGRYRCTPINDVGTGIVSETEIKVEEKPILLKGLNPEQTWDLTNMDQDFSVECNFRGKPLPQITWSRDSVPITGTGDSAILFRIMTSENVIDGDPRLGFEVKSSLLWQGERRDGTRRTVLRPDDNGNYTCEASNSRGKAASQMRLVVRYAPQFVDPKRKVAGDLRRGRVSLRCPVSAQPPPEVTNWYLPDGRMVTHRTVDARFSVRNEPPQLTNRIYTSVLTITRLTRADLTFYRCFSRNSQGNNTLRIELKNQSTPETPSHFRAQTSTWESIYLSWVPGFDGGFSQTFDVKMEWHNGEERRRMIRQDLFNLTNLRPNTSYTLRIAATNALGTGEFSSPPLVFTTEPLFIPRIQDVILDIASKKLRFTAPPGYCVRVDVSQDRGRTWLPFRDCLSHGEGSEIVASIAEEYRAALCHPRRMDVCSEFKLAQVSEGTPEVPLIVILAVAVACAVLIVALFAILIFFCIRRRPGRKNFEENVAQRQRLFPFTCGTEQAPSRRPQAVTINPYAPTPPSTGPAVHHSPPVKPFALVTPTSGAVHPPNTPAYENGAASFGQDDGECGRSSRGRASPWDIDKRNKTSTFGDSASVLTPHSNSSQDPLLASNADPPPYTDTVRRAPRQPGMEMQTIAIRDGTDGVYPTLVDSTPPRSMTISRSALSSPIPSTALQLSGGTIPRQPKKVIYEVVV